jgi:hypothetical protein
MDLETVIREYALREYQIDNYKKKKKRQEAPTSNSPTSNKKSKRATTGDPKYPYLTTMHVEQMLSCSRASGIPHHL